MVAAQEQSGFQRKVLLRSVLARQKAKTEKMVLLRIMYDDGLQGVTKTNKPGLPFVNFEHLTYRTSS